MSSKYLFIMLAIIFVVYTFVSCIHLRENSETETPRALQDENSSYVSKREHNNLIEKLYYELLEKDADLKKLENEINEIHTSREDSAKSFIKFDQKNQSYFSAANHISSEIKDSILRKKVEDLIHIQLAKYNRKITKHTELLEVIENQEATISDLHSVLKIIQTLPMIDKYQHDDLPGVTALQGYIKQQKNIIKLADTLSRK